MRTVESFDRWFVLASADAVATRSWSTEEIVEAFNEGALAERTVVYNRFDGRREGFTVGELVKSARAKKKK